MLYYYKTAFYFDDKPLLTNACALEMHLFSLSMGFDFNIYFFYEVVQHPTASIDLGAKTGLRVPLPLTDFKVP